MKIALIVPLLGLALCASAAAEASANAAGGATADGSATASAHAEPPAAGANVGAATASAHVEPPTTDVGDEKKALLGSAHIATDTDADAATDTAATSLLEFGGWWRRHRRNMARRRAAEQRAKARKRAEQHGKRMAEQRAKAAARAVVAHAKKQCDLQRWGGWQESKRCSRNCGGGIRHLKRSYFNKWCTNARRNVHRWQYKTEICNTNPCPVDCKVAESWASHGGCSASCNGGTQKQKLSVTTEPKHGGKRCPSLARSVKCNTQACPTCRDAGDIKNGRVSTTGQLKEGDAVSYTCIPGYRLVGGDERTCKKEGNGKTAKAKLTGKPPTCAIKDCGNPAVKRSTGLTADIPRTTFGGGVTFKCSKGYDLAGSAKRQCGADGKWSGVAPSCKIRICAAVDAPAHGKYEPDISKHQGSYQDKAKTTCDTGFYLKKTTGGAAAGAPKIVIGFHGCGGGNPLPDTSSDGKTLVQCAKYAAGLKAGMVSYNPPNQHCIPFTAEQCRTNGHVKFGAQSTYTLYDLSSAAVVGGGARVPGQHGVERRRPVVFDPHVPRGERSQGRRRLDDKGHRVRQHDFVQVRPWLWHSRWQG